jgi:hypothetical protein
VKNSGLIPKILTEASPSTTTPKIATNHGSNNDNLNLSDDDYGDGFQPPSGSYPGSKCHYMPYRSPSDSFTTNCCRIGINHFGIAVPPFWFLEPPLPIIPRPGSSTRVGPLTPGTQVNVERYLLSTRAVQSCTTFLRFPPNTDAFQPIPVFVFVTLNSLPSTVVTLRHKPQIPLIPCPSTFALTPRVNPVLQMIQGAPILAAKCLVPVSRRGEEDDRPKNVPRWWGLEPRNRRRE